MQDEIVSMARSEIKQSLFSLFPMKADIPTKREYFRSEHFSSKHETSRHGVPSHILNVHEYVDPVEDDVGQLGRDADELHEVGGERDIGMGVIFAQLVVDKILKR